MKPRLLIAESRDFSPESLKVLSTVFDVEMGDFDLPQLLGRVRHCEYLWVRLRHHIGNQIFDAAPNLKMIATNTTGLNHIDLVSTERRGIKVVSLRGETEFLKTIRATAELTIGLAFSLLRRIPAAHDSVIDGNWNRDLFQGRELFEKTVGILGYGRLGSIVAGYFRAFGSRVLICDPKLAGNKRADGFEVVSLPEILEKSDLISLHVNYTEDNKAFLGRAEFRQMRQGAWFINTARGELLDEPALLDAIRERHLSGVALDVISSEHESSTTLAELRNLSTKGFNVVLTPHIGGNTQESTFRTEVFLAKKLVSAATQP